MGSVAPPVRRGMLATCQVVCTNAGWYTIPRLHGCDHEWPHSLVNAPAPFMSELEPPVHAKATAGPRAAVSSETSAEPEPLVRAFARRLVLVLGQQDTGTKHLNVSAGAMAQARTIDPQCRAHRCKYESLGRVT